MHQTKIKQAKRLNAKDTGGLAHSEALEERDVHREKEVECVPRDRRRRCEEESAAIEAERRLQLLVDEHVRYAPRDRRLARSIH